MLYRTQRVNVRVLLINSQTAGRLFLDSVCDTSSG